MSLFARLVAVVAAPLLLTGCFFLPGKFDATLTLNKGGAYEFTYVGEMQVFSGDEKEMAPPKKIPFNPDFAQCRDFTDSDDVKQSSTYYDKYGAKSAYSADTTATTDAIDAVEDIDPTREEDRACTEAELADLKATEDKAHARKQEKYEQQSGMMAAMFGGAIPGNDAALQKFAKQLMKYDGWEKVTYVGENKFDIEYRATGTFDRYFAFPILNDAAMQYPFFQIIPRKSGELEVMAPAIGGSGSFMSLAMMGGMRGGMPKDMPFTEISGSFTIETNGEVLANNSPDGYASDGATKTMRWDLENLEDSPRALIKIK